MVDDKKEMKLTVAIKSAPNGSTHYEVKYKRKRFSAATLEDVVESLKIILEGAEAQGDLLNREEETTAGRFG